MRPTLRDLAARAWDVLVIGGGIFGSGIARDAALRGFSVALVECADFGGGTTANSSRLIHGGWRYLARGDVGLVRQAVREQELLLRLAPHRVTPLPFVVPLRNRSAAACQVAMALSSRLPRRWRPTSKEPMWWSLHETVRNEPILCARGLRGAAVYWDAQVTFPERLVMDNLRDARAHGALAVNYVQVRQLRIERGQVKGAVIEDLRGGNAIDVRAQWVVNATGCHVDAVVASSNPQAPRRMRRSKGVHLVVPQFTRHAVVLRAQQDRRLCFVIPWNGFSLIGTTDTACADELECPTATEDEVNYLQRVVRGGFPDAPADTVHYTFAGLRSLVRGKCTSPTRVSRRYRIVDHAEDGLDRLLSLIGGKMTTYRAVAQEVVDLICKRTGSRVACVTSEQPLVGDLPTLRSRVIPQARSLRWSGATVDHLIAVYGNAAEEVANLATADPALRSRVTAEHPTIWAEVAHAVDAELARSADDVLMRRTMLGLQAGVTHDTRTAVAEFVAQRCNGGRK